MTQIMQGQNLLSRVVLVAHQIRIWSGRKKLRPEDINVGSGGELPPEEVASLGSKKTVDTKELAVFGTLKRQLERHLDGIGIRFLGGWAIPEDKLPSAMAELDNIGRKFADAKRDFLADYNVRVEAWVQQHPQFEASLRRAISPVTEVDAGLQYGYCSYKVAPSEADSNNTLDKHISSMGTTLLDEVAAEAHELYERSIAGKGGQINRRIRMPLRRLRDKLDGFSFLDGSVLPMVQRIKEFLKKIPEEGFIEGALYHELTALTLILSDPEKIRKHAAGEVIDLPLFLDDAPLSAPDQEEDDDEDGEEDDSPDAPTAPAEAVVVAAPVVVDAVIAAPETEASNTDGGSPRPEAPATAASPVESAPSALPEAAIPEPVVQPEPQVAEEPTVVVPSDGPEPAPEAVVSVSDDAAETSSVEQRTPVAEPEVKPEPQPQPQPVATPTPTAPETSSMGMEDFYF